MNTKFAVTRKTQAKDLWSCSLDLSDITSVWNSVRAGTGVVLTHWYQILLCVDLCNMNSVPYLCTSIRHYCIILLFLELPTFKFASFQAWYYFNFCSRSPLWSLPHVIFYYSMVYGFFFFLSFLNNSWKYYLLLEWKCILWFWIQDF